ncbi:hypothetical protein V495_00020 [Pseudogymnoascus sp. VKM F-4514 (FW-929)]|nr:hypothetical protein V495_00020 [Pseudogymnoascus sp. VKM F-4514 (FW-929)]KFY66155.1 hypothetical protein V497_01108 [Pseudogymnoascus sp. VKM F-4516 (FW-969)]
MEDPLSTSVNDAFNMLDPEPLSYPNASLDSQVFDFFNPSDHSDAEPNRLEYASHSSNSALDFPKPHDDLSHFFSDSPFPSPTPGSRHSPTLWDGGLVSTAQDNWVPPINAAAPAPLSITTSGFECFNFRTVMHHGQATPTDSPEEDLTPPKSAKSASARRQSRKEKEIATATASASAFASSATSEENSTGSQGGSETKVKKRRKPRQSSKKRTTAEQAAAKRETALKRNREAAYKCRLKKKAQTVEVVERVKVLGEDNVAKGVEIKRLRMEVEGLRGLLLPHYRGCGVERVVAV